MRRLLATALAAGLLVPAAAEGAACRPLVSDPRHDTYHELVDEPGADIVALDLRSTATTLYVTTTLADVDAQMLTAPLGREIQVGFRLREASFVARHVQAVDKSYGALILGYADQGAGNENGSASAWAGRRVAFVPFKIDTARNQVRVDVPLKLLRQHAKGLAKNDRFTLFHHGTYDVEGLSEYKTGGSIDLADTGWATWNLGSRSCG